MTEVPSYAPRERREDPGPGATRGPAANLPARFASRGGLRSADASCDHALARARRARLPGGRGSPVLQELRGVAGTPGLAPADSVDALLLQARRRLRRAPH